MKKVVLSFMILSAVLSCKKDEKADPLPEHTEEVVSHHCFRGKRTNYPKF